MLYFFTKTPLITRGPLKLGVFEECLFCICFELQFGYSKSTAKYSFDQGCETDFAVNEMLLWSMWLIFQSCLRCIDASLFWH